MAVNIPALDGLERRRLELEGNIQRLRQSLYDWRLREAEYDGLKDEVKEMQYNCTPDEILEVGIKYDGTVVDEQEVKTLVGYGQNTMRSRDQVVNQISRRLDYVKQNVSLLEKRLSSAESELDALLSTERPGPNAAAEEYAVTEILEELDENGKVISSKVSKPGDHTPGIMEMLNKAGLEIPQGQSDAKENDEMEKEGETIDQRNTSNTSQVSETNGSGNSSANDQSKKIPSVAAISETSGSVLDETDDSDSDSLVLEVDESPEDAKLRREMLEYSFHEVGKVVAELEMDEEGSDVSYDEDYYDDEDEDEEEEEDEYGRTTRKVLTDDYHKQMRDLEERLKAGGYINLGPAGNLNAQPKETAEAASRGGVLKVTAIERSPIEPEPLDEVKEKPKKKVSFAKELDIAPEPKSSIGPTGVKERKIDTIKSEVAPLAESVVERVSSEKSTTSNQGSTEKSSTTKKPSRFKSARKDGTPTPGDSITASAPSIAARSSILRKSDQPPTSSSLSLFPARLDAPKPFSQPLTTGDVFASAMASQKVEREAQPPEGKITAEKLVERAVVDTSSILPPDPDEIDEELHRKEVATEFYRRRNLKIQQEGGFLKTSDDEDERNQLFELDENDQPKRKVSKFKAARLRS